jgi:peptidoglycan/LPS O-acetylase OafA/YrhL
VTLESERTERSFNHSTPDALPRSRRASCPRLSILRFEETGNPALEQSTRTGNMDGDMPNLDLLRAVAVSLVLAGHLTFFLGYIDMGPFRLFRMGDLGVQFFFVHTCFVLMLSLERYWKGQTPLELFGSFMIRRAFRIYPLSITVVLIIVIFRLPQARALPGHFYGATLSAGTIFSNLTLIHTSEPWVLGMLWTLPYEMAMYLLLPWIFLFVSRTRSSARAVALWLMAIVGSIVILAWLKWSLSDYFFEYTPCFLSGVIAYCLTKTRRRPQFPALLWIGAIGSVFPLHFYRRELLGDYRFKNWLVCLVIGLAIPCFSQISQKWITIPSHYIAKYSYGIYLTHFFCIWLAFEKLHHVLAKFARLGVFVVLAAGLPVLFYHLLEEPMILVGKRLAKRFETAYENRMESKSAAESAEA